MSQFRLPSVDRVANLASALSERFGRPAVIAAIRDELDARRAAIDQLPAALGVRQTYLGLAPLQLLALAFVSLGGVGLDNGHHPAVHLNDDHR